MTTYSVIGPVRGTLIRGVTLAQAARVYAYDHRVCGMSATSYSDVTIRRDDGEPLTYDEACEAFPIDD